MVFFSFCNLNWFWRKPFHPKTKTLTYANQIIPFESYYYYLFFTVIIIIWHTQLLNLFKMKKKNQFWYVSVRVDTYFDLIPEKLTYKKKSKTVKFFFVFFLIVYWIRLTQKVSKYNAFFLFYFFFTSFYGAFWFRNCGFLGIFLVMGNLPEIWRIVPLWANVYIYTIPRLQYMTL